MLTARVLDWRLELYMYVYAKQRYRGNGVGRCLKVLECSAAEKKVPDSLALIQ